MCFWSVVGEAEHTIFRFTVLMYIGHQAAKNTLKSEGPFFAMSSSLS